MTTAKEKIEIIQYKEDGGIVLYSLIDEDNWKILTENNPDFDWSTYEYKIVRETQFRITIDSNIDTINFSSRAELKRFRKENRIINFIEVEN